MSASKVRILWPPRILNIINMIGFLIFYFAFSAIFAVGAIVYNQDRMILEIVMAILLGWLLLPFGLGMLVCKLIDDDKNE